MITTNYNFIYTLLAYLSFVNAYATQQLFKDFNFTCVNPDKEVTSLVFLFSHGIDPRWNTGIRQAQEYITNGVITGPCYTFNYADSVQSVNFCQEEDYPRLAYAFSIMRKKYPAAKIVLVGLSRGASNIFQLLAQATPQELAHIAGIILESPFDTVDTMVEHIAQKYCWMVPKSSFFLKKVVKRLPGYQPTGRQPLDFARKVVVSCPFLITYSLQDKVIPPHGVKNLITALRHNKNNVIVLERATGKHSTASFDTKFQEAAKIFLHQNSCS